MRKRTQPEEQGMDSLMDTLTNVVGVLMFVLMIAMLNVNDAVRQVIRAEKGYDKKEVTIKELEEATKQAKQVEERVKVMASKEAEVRTTLADERRELAKVQATPPPTTTDPRPLQAQLQQQLKDLEAVEQQVKAAKIKVETLESRLAATPELEEVAAKIIRLPDPRSAPKGSKEKLFLCRGGRIFYANIEGMQNAARSVARRFKPEMGLIDCDALISEFKRRALGDKNYTLEIQVFNGHPYGVLARKPDAGETVEQIEATDSDFRDRLQRIDRGAEYCRFVVWPDSFEVYLRARELVDEAKVMAGWQPTTYAGEWYFYLPGITQFRCKNAPPPPPPTAPAAAKEGPPKPSDVID